MFNKFCNVLIILIAFSLISCSYASDVSEDINGVDLETIVVDSNSTTELNSNISTLTTEDNLNSASENNLSVSKFVASDMITHENNGEYVVSLVDSNYLPISGAPINIKFLDYDYNLINSYNLTTEVSGSVSVPCSLSSGIYFVFYEFFGNENYFGDYGMNRIEVIPYKNYINIPNSDGTFIVKDVDFKIPTSILIEDTNIYHRGDVFEGRLVDSYSNPICGKTIDLIEMNNINSYNGSVSLITDNEGYFSLPINKSSGVYSICCRFCGDDEYEYCQSLNYLNVSYTPNLRYLINLTNDGREIGIYKNNILYKYAYNCSVSGATKLVNNVLYFVSLEGSSYSLQNISSVSQIKSSGISLFSDGKNVLITYYGYVGKDTGYFNVIFDGKTSGNNHLCNLSLFYNENNVATLYFSSEKNINTYAPVYTNLTLFNKFYNVNSIYHVDSISEDNWENLYYGDINYGNYLSNANWSSNLGYESIQSYLISENKITDEDMGYYLNKSGEFSGVQKVAYENFLIALAYEWLNDKLANELADEYDVGWVKNGYSLISTFIGSNGRFISVIDTVNANSGLNFQEFNNMFYLYGSLLEEYVMGLTGYESTCAVSEVFKGLLNGEEFYYYEDNINGWPYTVLRLADNSSRLEFSPFGTINTIINMEKLQNKYNGGMCLGEFSYLFVSPLVHNLELLYSKDVYIEGVLSECLSSDLLIDFNLLEYCAGFSMFNIVFGSYSEAAIGTLSELIPESFAAGIGYVLLPIIFFYSIDGVGESDGYVEYYWKTHNMSDTSLGIPIAKSVNTNHLMINDLQNAQKWTPDEISTLDGTGGDGPDSNLIYFLIGGGIVTISRVISDLSDIFKFSNPDDFNPNYNISVRINSSDTRVTSILITELN